MKAFSTKIRPDIVRVYRDVHSWGGIVCGLFLFVAFYAGSLTMYERPLESWASSPVGMPPAASLERTPELLEKLFAAHPEARGSYEIVLHPSASEPARVVWDAGPRKVRGDGIPMLAALTVDGELRVQRQRSSEVGVFINQLHQQVGLVLPHDVGRYFMGCVALLYAVALISGTLVALPGLIKNLFAVRVGQNLKRMWLDVHTVLGLFSLPFHIIIALTCVIFAFHGAFYPVEAALLGSHPEGREPVAHVRNGGASALLTPFEVVDAVGRQAPGFAVETLSYDQGPGGAVMLMARGWDTRYGARGVAGGFAEMDPVSGKILSTDYLPGKQNWGMSVLTSFFALHFGTYGGALVRVGRTFLGLAGAFLFYAGNQLWIVSRRRRERGSGLVEDTRATRILSVLTVGCSLGCVTGVAAVLAVAPLLPSGGALWTLRGLYFGVFLLSLLTAGMLNERLAVRVLLGIAGGLTVLMPVSQGLAWSFSRMDVAVWGVDLVAVLYGALLMYVGAGLKTRRV